MWTLAGTDKELYEAIKRLFVLLETTTDPPDFLSPALYKKLHRLLGQIHPHLIAWEARHS